MGVMGKCRSCGAEVVWVKTRTGKSMPLEAVPPSEGNVRVVDGVAHVSRDAGTGPYVSHFARCPQGDTWRKS